MLPSNYQRFNLSCSLCEWTSGHFWVPAGADPPKAFQDQGTRHAWENHPVETAEVTGKAIPPWERGQPGTPG